MFAGTATGPESELAIIVPPLMTSSFGAGAGAGAAGGEMTVPLGPGGGAPAITVAFAPNGGGGGGRLPAGGLALGLEITVPPPAAGDLDSKFTLGSAMGRSSVGGGCKTTAFSLARLAVASTADSARTRARTVRLWLAGVDSGIRAHMLGPAGPRDPHLGRHETPRGDICLHDRLLSLRGRARFRGRPCGRRSLDLRFTIVARSSSPAPRGGP